MGQLWRKRHPRARVAPGPRRGIGRRLRKALGWAVSLMLAVATGGGIAAYHYVTDSDTLAELIRREAPKFLPGCRIDVLRVRLRPIAGDVTLTELSAREVGGAGEATVARLPYLQVRYDAWRMWTSGKFEAREVRLAKPTLRLARRADGSWNLQGLLADPWPGPKGMPLPPIRVQDGTVELAAEGQGGPNLVVLREVAIDIPASAGAGAPVAFELTAKGEVFDRVHVEGTIDPSTGRVELAKGELARLTLSEATRGKLPAEVASILAGAGLDGGEVDGDLASLAYDPIGTPKVRYRAKGRLRRGLWRCPKLPFPLGDVSVDVEAGDGRPLVVSAYGSDGSTSFEVKGTVTPDLDDPARSAFEARVVASKLQLDGRLRDWTPAKFRELWDLYCPEVGRSKSAGAGRVDLIVRANRPTPGAEVGFGYEARLIDVSMRYKHFPYKVDHVEGTIRGTPRRLDLAVSTVVGNKPLTVTGWVDEPGPGAVARLGFDVEALPVDEALLDALPPEVRKVVREFDPKGTVRGHADLRRDPPLKPGDDPRGRVQFDAVVDLNRGCSATWVGLKYPVRDLTGRLEIHPDLTIFTGMKGSNGQAAIRADGRVEQVRRGEFKVAVALKAANLPFDQQLRDALPKPWQLTWATLNPTGATDIEAAVKVEPGPVVGGKPREHHHIVITPRKQAGVILRFNPLTVPGAAPVGPLELRMDDVSGRFVFDTSTTPPTTMEGVGFTFQGAPVRFRGGTVDVADTGQFSLVVKRLEVSNLRLDEAVRRKMPPVMDQFARRLDDRPLSRITTDLGLGWSGKPGESAWCKWDDALVVLVDNKAEIGTDLALDHIQGQLDHVSGSFDGRSLAVRGHLDLESVSVFGQQITRLTSDLDVRDGLARMDRIEGKVLGGVLCGQLRASLDATPRYSAAVWVDKADLHEYAKAQPGQQSLKGLLTGSIDVSGQGADLHTLTGGGAARVVQGDLGHLPVALRFFNVMKLAKETATAFDSAEVTFKINNGSTRIDPVLFSGNAFSLKGDGTLDVRGLLDLKLRILAGRDAWHVPLISDVTRELGGQFLVVRVLGPVGSPSFRPEALPLPSEILRARLHKARGTSDDPWRTGLEGRSRSGLSARFLGGRE